MDQPTPPDAYDSPWKEILESYFPEFMAFFFPEIHADIDWSRGWESLDQELQQVVRDAESGRRLADKLFKVYRLDGQEQWVLIHVEIQGERDEGFARRMFTYNYRVFDRYERPVVSLAVLGDDALGWRPSEFGYALWGCEVGIRFPVIKLADYNAKWGELETSPSPFAIVVMAHLKTRATRRNPEDRLRWKTQLVRGLYERGYQRRDVLELMRFIDWLMALPEELALQFREEHKRFEEELRMRYVTTFERFSKQEGLEEGLRQGVQVGEASILKRLLLRRFQQLPSWVEQRLAQAGREQLEGWADRVFDAQRLEDVFA
ncbi:MAG: DUF4351 domain-containing protein [Thermoanaerobaculia bacterium]|nr:DUF4351 domain-containing protein [Thermoanaerobaculia bacterium]